MSEILNSKGITREEVKDYLDSLREYGVTNMFGACPYLVRDLGITQSEASAELTRWMREFSSYKRKEPSSEGSGG